MNWHSEHENPDGWKAGDTVKVVATGVKMMHLPKFKGGLVVDNIEGEIKELVFQSKDGVEVSTNRPVLVQFKEPCKFMAHFEFEELERTE